MARGSGRKPGKAGVDSVPIDPPPVGPDFLGQPKTKKPDGQGRAVSGRRREPSEQRPVDSRAEGPSRLGPATGRTPIDPPPVGPDFLDEMPIDPPPVGPDFLARSELAKLPLRKPAARGGYGWVRDLPDARDQLFAGSQNRTLPDAVDLTPECPPVYEQGALGSCTAHALAAAIEFDLMKQSRPAFTPSRLFIYFLERVISGSVGRDSGAQLRDGIKAVAKIGAPPETLWPYVPEKFAALPPERAFVAAKADLVDSYFRMPHDIWRMRSCLADGYPFAFGFTAYESFESATVARTGKVPMPGSAERMLGGHAVLAVGYDDAKRIFLVRNSWGAGWGRAGYCLMPYEYLITPHLAGDAWTIRSVVGG